MDEFEMPYDYAIAKKYGSLILDTTNEKRFLSNLDSELFINDIRIKEDKKI